MERALALAAIAALFACSHGKAKPYSLKNDKTICAEYRDLVCLTAEECSMDEQRGCRVCQCSPAYPAPQDGRQPDQRTPQ